jgi:hypothetical protein
MTAFGSIQDAVAAMKEGALDFLAKPVDPDHLLLMVERALVQRRLATENMILKDELAQRRGAPLIVGDDPKLKQVSRRCTARRRPTRPCCWKARAAPARSCSRARCTRSARATTVRSSRSTARRSPKPAGDGALRPRERRVHRRVAAQAGQVRARAPRHAVPRRNRRSAAVAAGQDPACARGEAVRARRRHGAAAGRRPRRRGDQSQSEGGSGGAAVPRGSLFPAVGLSDPDSAAARPSKDIPTLARYFIDKFCRDLNKKPLVLSPAAEEELVAYRGRATCASCRTASSGRRFSPKARPFTRAT